MEAHYGRYTAVTGISGAFAQGSLTAIAGPNGAGKSTLVKLITGKHRPSKGCVERYEPSLAYLPQRSLIDQSFPITVLDTVLLGHMRHSGWRRPLTIQERDQAMEALSRVDMAQLGAQPIAALSAGQFQRTLFARLIVQDARLILLDEPFNAIDVATTGLLLDLLAAWHREGRTIIAVLHDLSQIRENFPETLLLARELIAWGPTDQVLTRFNLDRTLFLAQHWDGSGAPVRIAEGRHP